MKDEFIHQHSLFYKTAAFSAGVHVLIIVVLLFGSLIPSRSINYNPVYTVSLVTSPGPSEEQGRAAEAVRPAPRPRVQQEQQRPAAPRPAPRMILPIESKAPPQHELLSAIRHINREVRQQQMLTAIEQAIKGEITSPGSSAAAGSTGNGMPSGPAAQQYYALVWQRIRDAWLVPPSMAASSYGYETVITITLQRDGTITDMSVEKSSGNIYFDQTAIRAIKKASPLAPFPPSWLQKSIDIGIKFSCKEGCK